MVGNISNEESLTTVTWWKGDFEDTVHGALIHCSRIDGTLQVWFRYRDDRNTAYGHLIIEQTVGTVHKPMKCHYSEDNWITEQFPEVAG